MQIIPAINELDFKEVKKKIDFAKEFGADWVHLDVSDGRFTSNILWNNPKDLTNLQLTTNNLQLKAEVHLMVQNPDQVLKDWLKAGVKRLIVHLESVKDSEVMKKGCDMAGVELFLAIKPDTPVEELLEYQNHASGFLILAVNPGLAGQKFMDDQIDKIRFLRQKLPDVKIEVDGGVNLENASRIKDAGADILVSASYIWGSKEPGEAYKQLKDI